MHTLYKILLALHVAGGAIGLVCGTIATAVVKGRKAHLLNGKLFFWAMLLASISALVISRMPGHENIFLFAIGGFTIYMIGTGYRMVLLKRHNMHNHNPYTRVDYSLFFFGTGFGLFLLVLAATRVAKGDMFSLVPAVFGLICLAYARADYAIISGKKTIKQFWLYNHIIRMMGALIASYTAFLVVNIQIPMQWILWLLPTVLGSVLIARFIRKYARPKTASAVIRKE
ncbi:hypothetical protein [Foetidibacter luteolus]|uniref:hypothetical protein n=1 Tax=Foetidibacter luteolus TaxID=2608880 RepID=UPI00129C0046|nr:hypothetical protein [Foetidibacter luteolus]